MTWLLDYSVYQTCFSCGLKIASERQFTAAGLRSRARSMPLRMFDPGGSEDERRLPSGGAHLPTGGSEAGYLNEREI